MTAFFKHVFTARDGISYSLTKLVGIAGAAALIYRFLTAPAPLDFIGFSTGVAAIMAALALKYAVEDREVK